MNQADNIRVSEAKKHTHRFDNREFLIRQQSPDGKFSLQHLYFDSYNFSS